LGGALTKAVLWVKNAVLAAIILDVAVIAADIAAELTPIRFGLLKSGLLTGSPGPQFCACAPDTANNETVIANPAAATTRRLRGYVSTVSSEDPAKQ
jgi:hypothetical protein